MNYILLSNTLISNNMKILNDLNVTLDLENPIYRPYQKENNQIKYICKY